MAYAALLTERTQESNLVRQPQHVDEQVVVNPVCKHAIISPHCQLAGVGPCGRVGDLKPDKTFLPCRVSPC